jgi:hypothetical protein
MIAPRLWPWKLIGKVAGALVLAGLVLVVNGWRKDSQALPLVERSLDAALEETVRVRKDLAWEVDRLQSVNEGLLNENEALRRVRAATPVQPVRLCRPAPEARAALAGDPAAAGRSDAAAAGAGVLPEEAGRDHPEGPGPDVGEDLYALADEANEMLRLLRGAQTYIAGLPAACSAAGP